MVQGPDVQPLQKLQQQAGAVAAAGVGEQLEGHTVQGIARAAVFHGRDQGLDDAQGILAPGLLVAHIKGAAVMVGHHIADDALPGHFQQLAGLVFVVVAFVEQTHGPAALHAVQHADRGIQFPGVVGVQTAQGRSRGGTPQLVGVAALGTHGPAQSGDTGHDNLSCAFVRHAEAVGLQQLACCLDARCLLAVLASSHMHEAAHGQGQLAIHAGDAAIGTGLAAAAPSGMAAQQGVDGLDALA